MEEGGINEIDQSHQDGLQQIGGQSTYSFMFLNMSSLAQQV
jgi:hypothetical protein